MRKVIDIIKAIGEGKQLETNLDGGVLKAQYSEKLSSIVFTGDAVKGNFFEKFLGALFGNNPERWKVSAPPKRYAKDLREALEAKQVQVTFPEFIKNNTDLVDRGFCRGGKAGWSVVSVSYFELALNHGGSVEILED